MCERLKCHGKRWRREEIVSTFMALFVGLLMLLGPLLVFAVVLTVAIRNNSNATRGRSRASARVDGPKAVNHRAPGDPRVGPRFLPPTAPWRAQAPSATAAREPEIPGKQERCVVNRGHCLSV